MSQKRKEYLPPSSNSKVHLNLPLYVVREVLVNERLVGNLLDFLAVFVDNLIALLDFPHNQLIKASPCFLIYIIRL